MTTRITIREYIGRADGHSQAELARRCGVSRQAIAHWISGRKRLRRWDVALALIDATGADIAEICAPTLAVPAADALAVAYMRGRR